ncbi:MAG TPA: rod shape-determining protein MreC [Syntrophomonadaceae bacterium]|nr:rod shape-determining protein MreC [Syntrophomonadaceae bacterium]
MLKLIRNKYTWIVLSIIIISLTVMNLTSSARTDITVVEKVIRDSFTPLQKGVKEFRDGWGGFGTILAEKKSLQKQLDNLEEERQRLSLENQALREFQAEAKRLQNIVDFTNNNIETYDLKPARIIARSPENWYQDIFIDKGANHGIARGMPVINHNGLVGRVQSVSEKSAQISLITDREMAVGVVVQESRDTNGIVEGLGDANTLRMINIPYYSLIVEGNVVVTSGLSQTYPPGIDIGIVDYIDREPSGLLLSATVRPVVNFDKLEEVLIITDYRPIDHDDLEGAI